MLMFRNQSSQKSCGQVLMLLSLAQIFCYCIAFSTLSFFKLKYVLPHCLCLCELPLLFTGFLENGKNYCF